MAGHLHLERYASTIQVQVFNLCRRRANASSIPLVALVFSGNGVDLWLGGGSRRSTGAGDCRRARDGLP